MWQRSIRELEVAVKILKQGATEMDRVKFLQEAAIMSQFKHPNVVTMYGVVTDEEPVSHALYIILGKRQFQCVLVGVCVASSPLCKKN